MKIISIDELFRMLDRHDHAELHIHHTWKPTHKQFTGSNHIRIQQNMKAHHIRPSSSGGSGFSDIAQHISIFPDGKIVTGRNFANSPASITGFNIIRNKPSFCVELIGNFDVEGASTSSANNLGYDKLEGEQLDSIVKLARYFHIKNKYIRFHNENSSKTCPGNGISKGWFMNLIKGEGDVVVNKNNNMTDIKGHWAEESIKRVISDKVMSGYPDGTFKPNQALTRAELASLLHSLIINGKLK